jgi:hypothetical protein
MEAADLGFFGLPVDRKWFRNLRSGSMAPLDGGTFRHEYRRTIDPQPAVGGLKPLLINI